MAWVIDRGAWQAQRGAETLDRLIAMVLEDYWEAFDASPLTPKERQELRAIPSQVAHLIPA
jgi:hypothetical protein